MVHRAPDSRLLVALSTHEQSYHKHLLTLLDVHSQQALSSLAAYASATPPGVARGIMAVAGSFAGADEALRKYAEAEGVWRDALEEVKQAEEDVARVMRDRDILVTRLIKVSKSQKSTRDSFMATISPSPSSTALTPPPNPEASTSSTSLLTSPAILAGGTKLSAAQAELQACEATLAKKEGDLDRLRVGAVRRGLEARCKAMVECGWTWGEMGKEGLRALADFGDGLGAEAGAHDKPLPNLGAGTTTTAGVPNGHAHAPPATAGSDLSSIAPSQSASQIFVASPEQIPARPTSPVPNLTIPPAHAISEFHSPPFERRITEESSADLHTALEGLDNGDEDGEDGEASSDEEDDGEGEGEGREVRVVENKPFAAKSRPGGTNKKATPTPARDESPAPQRKRFPFRHQRQPSGSSMSTPPSPVRNRNNHDTDDRDRGEDRERKPSFLAGIAGFFRSSSRADSPSYGGGGSESGKWKTRTDTNLRAQRRWGGRGHAADDSDSDDGGGGARGRKRGGLFRRRASEDSYAPPSHPHPPSPPLPPSPSTQAKLRKSPGKKRVAEHEKVKGRTGGGEGEAWMSDGVAGGSRVGERAKRASVKRRGTGPDDQIPSSTSAPVISNAQQKIGSTDLHRSNTASTTATNATTTAAQARRRQKGATWSAPGAQKHPDAGRGQSLMALVEGSGAGAGTMRASASDTGVQQNSKKPVTRAASVDGARSPSRGGGARAGASAGPATSARTGPTNGARTTQTNARAASVDNIPASASAPPSLFLPTAPPKQSASTMFLPSASAYASASPSSADTGPKPMFLPSASAYMISGSGGASTSTLVASPVAVASAPTVVTGSGAMLPARSASVGHGNGHARSRSAGSVPQEMRDTTVSVVRSSSKKSTKSTASAATSRAAPPAPAPSLPKASASSSSVHKSTSPPLAAPAPSKPKATTNGSGSNVPLPAHIAQIHTPAHHAIAAAIPLKSALRNRTPSPMPPAGGSSSSSSSPARPPPQSQPHPQPQQPLPVLAVPSAPGRVILPVVEQQQQETKPPPSSEWSAKRLSLIDETASISSYDTGNEVFEDAEEGDGSGNSPLLPSLPPKTVVVPATPVPPSSTIVVANGSAVTLTHLVVPGSDDQRQGQGQGQGSDLSYGSGSTAMGSDGVTTTRRKSVRVSLQPTFSPTPPALDDEGDESEGGGYWVRGRKDVVGNSKRRSGGGGGGGGTHHGESDEEKWRDSSDEDEEYSRARAALTKLRKKW